MDEDAVPRSQQEKSSKQDAILHRNSAPARLSEEKERLVNPDDNQNVEEVKKKKRISVSFPSMKKPTWTSSNSSAAKKNFFIVPDIIDSTVWNVLEANRDIIKQVAKKHNLKSSNFYLVSVSMRRSLIEGNPYIFTIANHFLFSLMKEKEFKSFLESTPSYIPVPNQDQDECTKHIRNQLNILTDSGIAWPSTERSKNQELYYKELLELNKSVKISSVQAPYIAANIVIHFLPQIVSRALNHKTDIKAIIESPKMIRRHLKQIHETLAAEAIFISKNLQQQSGSTQEKISHRDDDEE